MDSGKQSGVVGVKTVPTAKLKPSKWLERTLIILSLVGSLAVLGLYQDLYDRYQSHANPKQAMYGVWYERDAAPFARDWFELTPDKVIIDNRVVATEFKLSRDELTFYVGPTLYRYHVVNEAKTELRQLSPAHYHPIFVLSGKHKNNLL
ncbi:hypothetical protein VTH8203_04128 [Vibrio thalassae]|uniref:DUF2850 domain-containing protein n=1 Tax=Vibrio thalassae TaxID=1243014 RepID=A0A240EP83_9VIBR|nr:DUF2850 domain-containing protein [Vibrio thalassae]SNX50468.1 hypothetical protein VTH8203_04128 [Vibrio thalassae]